MAPAKELSVRPEDGVCTYYVDIDIGRRTRACCASVAAGARCDRTHRIAGSRACAREHAANWQLGKPARRFCNSQMARGLPSVLGHQPPYQADRPQCARDIRGRIGLALDCRSGPAPRMARCRRGRALIRGRQGLTPSLTWIKAVGIEDGNYETVTTCMQLTVIVWDLKTVPDLGGFEHSERVQDRQHRSQSCDDFCLPTRTPSRMEFSERTASSNR